jgi:4'-phosphopantetheinyl transferase
MNVPPLAFRSPGLGAASAPEQLGADEVHVWGVDLRIGPAASDADLLSREERERAGRFVSGGLKRDFVVAHSALRIILGRYCGQPPERLRFGTNASGKPALIHAGSGGGITFNLSHSHGRALVAVARGREVGVDLELLRSDIEVVKLARRFFAKPDIDWIESGNPQDRQARFFRIWVARESVAKAEGTGVTFPLQRHYVRLSADAEHGRLMRHDQGVVHPDMLFRYLPLETGWIGAVASEGDRWRVVLRG